MLFFLIAIYQSSYLVQHVKNLSDQLQNIKTQKATLNRQLQVLEMQVL